MLSREQHPFSPYWPGPSADGSESLTKLNFLDNDKNGLRVVTHDPKDFQQGEEPIDLEQESQVLLEAFRCTSRKEDK